MGIYDRDYERGYGSGGFGGGGGLGGGGFDLNAQRSANTNLLLALVAAYIAQLVFSPTVGDLFSLPSDWLQRPWRAYGLLTYPLLHSEQQFNHLLFNGIALFFFGRAIEPRLGGREYLTFFFTAAAFAGVVWTIAENASGAVGPGGAQLIGASGGIAAVLILFALWYPHMQVLFFGVIPIPAWLMAVIFLWQDIMGALSRSGNVAYTAHLGGALFGFLYFRYRWRLSDTLFGWVGGDWKLPSLKPRPRLRVHKEDDDEPADPDDKRLDAVLEKIQREGQDSLTSSERRVLEQASQRYKQRRQ